MSLVVGTKITASTVSPAILGVGILNTKLLGILVYSEALKHDPEIPFKNKAIYNSIHIAQAPEVKDMVFLLLEDKTVVSLDWLRPDSIHIHGDIPLLKIDIVNATQVLVETLDELFTTAGILNFNLQLLQAKKTDVLVLNIEVSYIDDMIRLKILSIIRGLGITEFTYEVIK